MHGHGKTDILLIQKIFTGTDKPTYWYPWKDLNQTDIAGWKPMSIYVNPYGPWLITFNNGLKSDGHGNNTYIL